MAGIVRRALLSVSDKTDIVDFARALAKRGIEVVSTGGTARLLAGASIAVTEVERYTGFPEMLDGRVKTLHPKIHAGILARRDIDAHRDALARHDIPEIGLVVVNLYPFRETIADPKCTLDDAIENIDIGGPAMVRSAAKNWKHVGVVVDPGDYARVLEDLDANGGALSDVLRFALMRRAFAHTATYDGVIANYLTARDPEGRVTGLPDSFHFAGEKRQDMRYGENPHQSAALYREPGAVASAIASYVQLQGKELSFNNIADADAAWRCVNAFDASTCVIVKHANPCGVASAEQPVEAYRAAFATDPTSAFGGIIAFNRMVDGEALEAVSEQFVEVLIAPGYAPDAMTAIARKKNVRVLEVAPSWPTASGAEWDMKRVGGGMLVQTADDKTIAATDLRVVTKLAPTADQIADLLFAWRVAWFVKSNAIVYCAGLRTLGIGAGQMSRVDSTRIAAIKADNAGLSLAGSVVASDAFFPFRDGLDVVADNGAIAVIQPGGSVRDDEVIAAADERGIAMVFTGVRHFRH
ncbi:MAG TPA: bifunctional phosphoribosylaminoimidazolecarboxamide formyltransferase/IMP cyclohydrolase [Casimicrobiaceae bacterium]|nr:bifunctional phosphoribosylaminoimidazolecarboxamide formyltransferase/IMP cyclohydrolase [Casimicrobiaceae bacterium]